MVFWSKLFLAAWVSFRPGPYFPLRLSWSTGRGGTPVLSKFRCRRVDRPDPGGKSVGSGTGKHGTVSEVRSEMGITRSMVVFDGFWGCYRLYHVVIFMNIKQTSSRHQADLKTKHNQGNGTIKIHMRSPVWLAQQALDVKISLIGGCKSSTHLAPAKMKQEITKGWNWSFSCHFYSFVAKPFEIFSYLFFSCHANCKECHSTFVSSVLAACLVVGAERVDSATMLGIASCKERFWWFCVSLFVVKSQSNTLTSKVRLTHSLA